MTGNLLRNHWLEIRRDCRVYWGKLTTEDLEQIDGQFDRFVKALRSRYGFSQIKAEEELEQFLFCYSDEDCARQAVGRTLAEASL